MIHKKSTLEHFGIEELGQYRGHLHDQFIHDVKDAIEENQMTALIGSFGSGKSMVAKMAIEDLMEQDNEKYKFAFIDSADLENISIGQMMQVIIQDLSSESVKRSTQGRSRQMRRIVGEMVANDKRVCVVVENAHRLSSTHLMALKDEHDKHYLGYDHVFSLILVGQEKLLGNLKSRNEVFWRTLVLNMSDENVGWMKFDERVKYLEAVFGKSISPKARRLLAKKANKPLKMEFLVREKMEEGKSAGKKQVDGDSFPGSIRSRREALGVSLKDVADKAGVGKTTVHDVEDGQPSTKKEDVEQALREMEAEAADGRRQTADGSPARKASETSLTEGNKTQSIAS